MLTVIAPAKLNLTLEVLAKRPDNYHDIRSVVQTVKLNDRLSFKPGSNIQVKCNMPEWEQGNSLVSKAVTLLRQRTGKGAIIEIDKHIPLVAGLGGDSSDAAAVLRGLNLLWELGLSLRDLASLAVQLGSDVLLFLFGGTLLVEGRGEKVTPLPPMPRSSAVIFLPPLPRPERKTERLYTLLREVDFTTGGITDSFVNWLNARSEQSPPVLFNVFDNIAPAFYTGLEKQRQLFIEAGARDVHLAGSGPALFTLAKDGAEAEGICCRLGEKGLESYVADF